MLNPLSDDGAIVDALDAAARDGAATLAALEAVVAEAPRGGDGDGSEEVRDAFRAACVEAKAICSAATEALRAAACVATPACTIRITAAVPDAGAGRKTLTCASFDGVLRCVNASLRDACALAALALGVDVADVPVVARRRVRLPGAERVAHHAHVKATAGCVT